MDKHFEDMKKSMNRYFEILIIILSSNVYRVAKHYRLYLTASGIIIQGLKSIGQFQYI